MSKLFRIHYLDIHGIILSEFQYPTSNRFEGVADIMEEDSYLIG